MVLLISLIGEEYIISYETNGGDYATQRCWCSTIMPRIIQRDESVFVIPMANYLVDFSVISSTLLCRRMSKKFISLFSEGLCC